MDRTIDCKTLQQNSTNNISREIIRGEHKFTKIISGSTIYFLDVPSEIAHDVYLLCDSIQETEIAYLIMVVERNSLSTTIHKNRFGNKGFVTSNIG